MADTKTLINTECFVLVTPTQEQLDTLDAEQRERLARYVGTTRCLQVRSPGWEGVVAALDAELGRAGDATK